MPDEPSSSIADQTEALAPSGLDLEIEIPEQLSDPANWRNAIERAVGGALAGGMSGPLPAAELYVEIVDNEKSQELNRDYRGKDKPTNVLSFPGIEPDDLPDALKFAAKGGPPVMLGDLIIAEAVVVNEAADQRKTPVNHLVHLVVHGVLHLLGHDHINDDDADEMEDLERVILAKLGIADPYQVIEE